MKALYFENGDVRIKNVNKPIPTQYEAQIKVLKAGICNTDIELTKGYMNFSGILGISHKDGVFAEYLTLPVDNLYSVPDSVSDIEAVFIEPLAAA